MPGDPTAFTPPADHVRIGRIGRAFQLDGGLRLHLAGPTGPDALDGVERVFVTGLGPAAVRGLRLHAGQAVLYLEGVRDREAARRLAGAELFVARSALSRGEGPAAAVPEALVGAQVVLEGASVGRVRDVLGPPANPLAAVEVAGGEILLPLGAPYVRCGEGRIDLVDPPEGLLEPA